MEECVWILSLSAKYPRNGLGNRNEMLQILVYSDGLTVTKTDSILKQFRDLMVASQKPVLIQIPEHNGISHNSLSPKAISIKLDHRKQELED